MAIRFENEKGFTLLEAVIVLGIIAILLGAFGTALARWIPDQRFNSYVLDLQGAVQQARLEAVKNDAKVFFELDKTAGQFEVVLDSDDSQDLSTGDATIAFCVAPEGVVFTNLLGSPTANSALFTFNSRGISDTDKKICLKNINGKYKGVQLTLAGSSRIIRSTDGSSWQ